MTEQYFIRKVLYTGHDTAQSFDLDDPYPEVPDAYGVYTRTLGIWKWIDDFDTFDAAQKFVIERQG